MTNTSPIADQDTPFNVQEAQYAHPHAQTEWWWHIGTLIADNGQKFGFEINAARLSNTAHTKTGLFSQIALSDVSKQKHYQETVIYPLESLDPNIWAESDPSQPWYVGLEKPLQPNQGYISMKAIDNDSTHIHLIATATDEATGDIIKFDLKLKQEGSPLLVWGTGQKTDGPGNTNYYYSLTNLHVTGTISITSGGNTVATQTHNVTGVTWMDHEYGAFGKGTKWSLQDMQLDNGIQLSNYTTSGLINENQPTASVATLLINGESIFVDSITTASKPFPGPDGITYFLEYAVEIRDQHGIDASLTVKSLIPDQYFSRGKGDVYEGVAECAGKFSNSPDTEPVPVKGKAWIEQNFAAPSK